MQIVGTYFIKENIYIENVRKYGLLFLSFKSFLAKCIDAELEFNRNKKQNSN